MTFNHAFTLGVAVPGSHYESAEECVANEPELVIHALLARVAELVINRREMLEAMDPFDTYEE